MNQNTKFGSVLMYTGISNKSCCFFLVLQCKVNSEIFTWHTNVDFQDVHFCEILRFGYILHIEEIPWAYEIACLAVAFY